VCETPSMRITPKQTDWSQVMLHRICTVQASERSNLAAALSIDK
jgi:hypothetical protein